MDSFKFECLSIYLIVRIQFVLSAIPIWLSHQFFLVSNEVFLGFWITNNWSFFIRIDVLVFLTYSSKICIILSFIDISIWAWAAMTHSCRCWYYFQLFWVHRLVAWCGNLIASLSLIFIRNPYIFIPSFWLGVRQYWALSTAPQQLSF